MIREFGPAMFWQARRSCLSSTLRGMLRRQRRKGLMNTLGSRRRAAFDRATASRMAASFGVNSSAARLPGRITALGKYRKCNQNTAELNIKLRNSKNSRPMRARWRFLPRELPSFAPSCPLRSFCNLRTSSLLNANDNSSFLPAKINRWAF